MSAFRGFSWRSSRCSAHDSHSAFLASKGHCRAAVADSHRNLIQLNVAHVGDGRFSLHIIGQRPCEEGELFQTIEEIGREGARGRHGTSFLVVDTCTKERATSD